ncbi:MAG TPA: hypothetical protein ENF78_06060 [Candidatus Bathyarchaeota archaeon]|nr:hypothetical protein [Candidatus Bathyarchaeota archaeon]
MRGRTARYRSKLRIIADILTVINEEGGAAGPTRILYGANLSHERMMRYLAEMEEKGLVRRVEVGNRTLYEITDRGRKLLREVRKMEEFLRAFGLGI